LVILDNNLTLFTYLLMQNRRTTYFYILFEAYKHNPLYELVVHHALYLITSLYVDKITLNEQLFEVYGFTCIQLLV